MSNPGLGRRGWIVLVGLVTLLAAWVLLQRRNSGQRHEGALGAQSARILHAVPAEPMAMLMVDVAGLRRTELGHRLLSAEGRQIPGLGPIQTLCGQDPMSGVTSLLIALPKGEDVGFGLHAHGALSPSTWQACAEKLVGERNGRLISEQVGAFRLFRDTSQPVGSPVLAVADGGPLIFAPAPYVQASLEAAQGKRRSADQDEAHRWLRAQVAPGQMVATAVVSPRHRELLQQRLSMGGGQPSSSWRSVLLGVEGVAASLGFGPQVELNGVLKCGTEGQCMAVAVQLKQGVERSRRMVAARTSALGVALDRLVVRREGAVVHWGLSLSQPQFLGVLKGLMLALRGDERAPPATSRPVPRTRQSGGKDAGSADPGVLIETIEPDPDAGIE